MSDLTPSTRPDLARRTFRLAVAAILTAHAAVLAVLAWITPWTTDEPAYALAGMAIRMHRDWDVFETTLQGPVPLLANQTYADWLVPARPFEDYVFYGRLGMLPFAILLGLVLVWFGARLISRRAALAALVLHCANPVVLANGSLMTVDVAAAATSLLLVAAAWRWLVGPSTVRLVIVGAAIGLALATKYSAMLLLPAIALAAVVEAVRGFRPRLWWTRARGGPLRTVGDLALAGLVCAVAAWLVLWLCYLGSPDGYHVVAAGPDAVVQPRDPHSPPCSALLQRLVAWPVVPHLLTLLPTPFVRGLDFQWHVQEQGALTVFGDRVTTGDPAFYAVSLGVKLPLALSALVVVGVLMWRPRREQRAGPLLLAAVALPLAAHSFFSSLQMGIRYLLPILPILMLPAGVAVVRLWEMRRAQWLGRVAVTASAVALLWFHVRVWPYYTSAFNVLADDRPYLLFTTGTNLCWPYRPSERPDVVMARHPDAVLLRREDGPRLGVCVAYGSWLGGNDPRDPTHVYHWLRRFPPIDREGPWFVFDATDAAFAAVVGEGTATPDARGLVDLAIARLAAGDTAGARAAAEGSDDPDAERVLAAVAALEQGEAGLATYANAMVTFGRADVVPELGDRLPVATRANALSVLGRWRDLVTLLRAVSADRPLSATEVAQLQWALRQSGRPEEALALLEDYLEHLPPAEDVVSTTVRAKVKEEIAGIESDLAAQQRRPDLRLDR